MLAMVEAMCFPFFVVLSVPLFQFLMEGEILEGKAFRGQPSKANLSTNAFALTKTMEGKAFRAPSRKKCRQNRSLMCKTIKAKPFVDILGR